MARIGDDSLIVRGEQRADGTWLFTIRYTVHFEPGELGTRFADSVQVSADSRATRCVPRVRTLGAAQEACRRR